MRELEALKLNVKEQQVISLPGLPTNEAPAEGYKFVVHLLNFVSVSTYLLIVIIIIPLSLPLLIEDTGYETSYTSSVHV